MSAYPPPITPPQSNSRPPTPQPSATPVPGSPTHPAASHAPRRQVLIHRGRGKIALHFLNESGDMKRLHVRQRVQAIAVALGGEAPGSMQVEFSCVVVRDLGSKKLQRALCNPLRWRKQRPRKHSVRKRGDQFAVHAASRFLAARISSS